MKNNKLDEMQEQKLLAIEHNGCWLAFWGLLLALLIQAATGADFRALAGEWILFMALAVYLGFACMHAGIWDRRLEMNFKTNLVVSLAAALIAGLFLGLFVYARYRMPQGSLATGLIAAAVTFVLCLASLQLTARAVRKRQAALQAEPEDELP